MTKEDVIKLIDDIPYYRYEYTDFLYNKLEEKDNQIEILNNQVKRIRRNLEKLFDNVLYEEIYKEKNKLEKDHNMTISELREKFIESMINGGE